MGKSGEKGGGRGERGVCVCVFIHVCVVEGGGTYSLLAETELISPTDTALIGSCSCKHETRVELTVPA